MARRFSSRIGIVAAVVVSATVSLGYPASASSAQDLVSLGVMSYNIQGRNLSDHGGGPALAADVKRYNLDVVGLQETEEEETTNLAKDLGWRHWAWQETNDPAGFLGPRPEGIGIVSRHALFDPKSWKLPDFEGDERDRYLISAVVDVGGTRVLVFNAHTSHLGTERVEREEQSRFILRQIDEERSRNQGIPAVLTGDLNARPNDLSISLLREQLVDTWAFVSPDSLLDRCTSGTKSLLPPECGETSPGHPGDDATVDHKKIDYVFASREFRTLQAVTAHGATRSDVSDHSPTSAVVLLEQHR